MGADGGQHPDWLGRPYRPTRRTVERKIASYEMHGLAGLGPQRRADKGQSRVIISKPWDEAAPFMDNEKQRIVRDLQAYIRGLYKDGASAKIIMALAHEKLCALSISAGWTTASPDLCSVPRRIVEAESVFRKVAVLNKDRKQHEDARPRIRRTRDGLAPMDVVFGDVHPLDIVMRREDGSETWPKLIAWLDAGTNRLRFDVIVPKKGEGVRNADVIHSFINMTQDPAWGLPRNLYLDNGSEYNWAAFIDDAMKLVSRVEFADSQSASQIIRALPYNAQAKPIEGLFGRLEQNYFRTIAGWAGGDRLNKKTARAGRPTEPFPGTQDALRETLAAFLTAYENLPQRGGLKGMSPRALYEAAVAAGWQRIDIDAGQLRTVFASTDTRQVKGGTISYNGRTWTCDELHGYLGRKVTILVPKYETPAALPLLDEAGKVLGFAMPDHDYALLDRAGARESSRRNRTHKRAIRDLSHSAPDIDTNIEILNYAARQPSPTPAPSAGTITVSKEAEEVARTLQETPESRRRSKREQDLKRQSERLAVMTGLRLPKTGTDP